MLSRSSFVLAFIILVGCGPSTRNNGSGDDTDSTCTPGKTGECYDGVDGTEGVGPCHSGSRTCDASGLWGPCTGEVVPAAESCSDGIDNNCNGMVDEDVDMDGDGVTTCGGDCCDSTECSDPKLVNPGAFDAPGNNVDDDCNGMVDDAVTTCDQNLASGSMNGMDYAKAIDLCQTATMADKKWGVISATLTLADGTGVPAAKAQSIRSKYGTNVLPKGGTKLAELSTGAAASMGDTNPAYQDLQDGTGNGKTSGFPADFVAANGNKLPNAPGCPAPLGSSANDPVMLTLTVRVPTNAKSFKLATNFFSSEFPEYTCSPYNDFFVVLLDSAYAGTPANPSDKNLAFYQPMSSSMKYPVGVNLAHGDTGLFTQCKNGATGCETLAMAVPGTINTCTDTSQLAGTGLDAADGSCDSNSLEGGATGWLETTGNVNPGEIMKLRIAIWDTSDSRFDSLAVIDGFQWSVDTSNPGTVIFKEH